MKKKTDQQKDEKDIFQKSKIIIFWKKDILQKGYVMIIKSHGDTIASNHMVIQLILLMRLCVKTYFLEQPILNRKNTYLKNKKSVDII